MKLTFLFLTLFLISSCDPFEEILMEAEGLLEGVGLPPQADCTDCQQAANPACPSNQFLGKNIVYIGDSHSYLFSADGQRMGNHIMNSLKTCGAGSVYYGAACGSRPRHWYSSAGPKSSCGITSYHSSGHFKMSTKGSLPNLETLINDNSADLVIINLGDNMFGWSSVSGLRQASAPTSGSIRDEVQSLLQNIPKQTQCIWIGPAYHSRGGSYYKPNSEVDKLYSGITGAINGRCQIVDSRGYFSQSAPNDGLHFTSSESQHWGERLASTLKGF